MLGVSLTLAVAALLYGLPTISAKSGGAESADSAAISATPKGDESWAEPPEEAFAAQEQEAPAHAIVATQPTKPISPDAARGAQRVQVPTAATTAQSVPLHRAPTPAEAEAYIAQARTKIQLGDIAAARRLLERASEGGEGEAVFALAETYDPRMLAKWRVLGTKPDIEIAKALYNKAASRGARGAKERLLALGD